MHLKTMVDHLCVIGETILNKDLILYGLGVLDSNYNYFVSSYENIIY